MEKIKIEYLAVRSKGVQQLTQCIKESIILALEEDIEVHLYHNGAVYEISPGDLIFIIESQD